MLIIPLAWVEGERYQIQKDLSGLEFPTIKDLGIVGYLAELSRQGLNHQCDLGIQAMAFAEPKAIIIIYIYIYSLQ